MRSAGPATRISTPSASLNTSPASANSWAHSQTNGRNPTPCTRPRTRISRDATLAEGAPVMPQPVAGRDCRRHISPRRILSAPASPLAVGERRERRMGSRSTEDAGLGEIRASRRGPAASGWTPRAELTRAGSSAFFPIWQARYRGREALIKARSPIAGFAQSARRDASDTRAGVQLARRIAKIIFHVPAQ